MGCIYFFYLYYLGRDGNKENTEKEVARVDLEIGGQMFTKADAMKPVPTQDLDWEERRKASPAAAAGTSIPFFFSCYDIDFYI